jgi:hypothetical protein
VRDEPGGVAGADCLDDLLGFRHGEFTTFFIRQRG